MKPKLILCLALVLSGGLVGCESTADSSLDAQRQRLAVVYKDGAQPMAKRVTAFDQLLATFKAGTPCTVLDKYVVGDTITRVAPKSDVFVLHLNAPDGSDRWINVKGEDQGKQVVAD